MVLWLQFATEKEKNILLLNFRSPLIHSRPVPLLRNTILIFAMNERDWWPCTMLSDLCIHCKYRSLQCYSTLCKAIHVQQNDTCPTVTLRNCACVKQVLIGRKLSFGFKVQRQQIHCTVEWFSNNQNPGYRISPSLWLVENHSTVWCICCSWTFYPKVNFQPIRTCLTQAQIGGMTVGFVSFRWTCIALHSVYSILLKLITLVYSGYLPLGL